MVYGLAQSSMMWMLAFCCGWTCYPSALPSHLISDWALQTHQRPQRTYSFLMGFFFFFLFFWTQIISIGWGKAKDWSVKTRLEWLEYSHTPWICLAGRQDQAGIRKASGRYMQKAQRATTQTQISTFPSLWITHITTMALEWLREMDRHIGMTQKYLKKLWNSSDLWSWYLFLVFLTLNR